MKTNCKSLFTWCIVAFLLVNPYVAQSQTDTSSGAYLAKIADCVACHTGPGQLEFAGGLPIKSPFGIIYSSNITPDPDYGIGRYSLAEFSHAVRDGVARDGRHLYPAMPYPSFAGISDADIAALYDFFMHGVQPSTNKAPETKLPFPFNIRLSLLFWNIAFSNHQGFSPQADRDPQWNRGAYLVQALGHCGACHTPRGLAFQEKAYSEKSAIFLSGADVDNWYSANLTGDLASGLGQWTEADIAAFLQTGHGAKIMVFGSMTDVINNSTRHLHNDDAYAIAHYLKSLPGYYGQTWVKPASGLKATVPDELNITQERPGAGLYAGFCAKCHQLDGLGKADAAPKLAANPVIMSKNPMSLIRLVLEGNQTSLTARKKTKLLMPGFADKFTDQACAEVLSYIRRNWGNNASPVTTRQVAMLRKALQHPP